MISVRTDAEGIEQQVRMALRKPVVHIVTTVVIFIVVLWNRRHSRWRLSYSCRSFLPIDNLGYIDPQSLSLFLQPPYPFLQILHFFQLRRQSVLLLFSFVLDLEILPSPSCCGVWSRHLRCPYWSCRNDG